MDEDGDVKGGGGGVNHDGVAKTNKKNAVCVFFFFFFAITKYGGEKSGDCKLLHSEEIRGLQ